MNKLRLEVQKIYVPQAFSSQLGRNGAVGVNAFTSKELTCYYAKVVSDKIDTAADVLADLMKDSKLDADELDKERMVVLEEIAMVNDHPDDLAHEQISIDYFKGSGYSQPIIGPADNVKRFSRDD